MTDRRDSFRIDEDVHFEFKLVASTAIKEQAAEQLFEGEDDALQLVHKLSQLDKKASQSLKLIAEKNRLLGDFLNNLNQKVDLIGRQLLLNSEQSLKSRAKTRVSLSEDGIGFICERSLYKDSFIALKLIFLPHYAMACSYAQIVRCVQKEDKYQVAAKFHQIYDKDRQTIARQVLKSQVQARKPAKP
ncbi:PilZ domain-containing protein [Agaribacterium haliotis]|uniref:PilZ domain-containing protein n=1 Tax=Agaribacterium haliotis TaxID=2013869 RepID=UPI000BB577DA|nr:PilZ domain-containing protein [Agaribacterium haliotis]